MKNLFVSFAATALFVMLLVSCGNSANEQRLQQENDSLRTEHESLEQEMNLYFSTMSEIADNLDKVKTIGGYLSQQSTAEGTTKDPKQRIDDNIKTVAELIQQNNDKIAQLTKRLSGSSYKIKELEKTISHLSAENDRMTQEIVLLQEQLGQKNEIIAMQNANIKDMQSKNSDLAAANAETAAKVAQQTEQMNTAWYVFGSKKELKAQGIIAKNGIGASKKVLQGDFNKDFMVKVDIRNTDEIPLYSRRAKVLTTHPAGSYVLEKKDELYILRITDKQTFWSVSRYLVIEVK